jgi:crotonobetainyl-CoA:carnitine CoA-transferase CaiB-like acyl-CoA transferase
MSADGAAGPRFSSGARAILAGVRVLDVTQIVAGPVCTRILADLGADVVKIDPPGGKSDPSGGRRSTGPVAQNAGKRSVVLNLKSAEGVALAQELAATADVLVQNYRPGALEALGLGCEALRGADQRLIYVTISGFGQDTSYRERGAFGATAHAEAGWLWVQQMAQGGHAPFAPGVTVADVATGMNAAMAILAALYDRERTGEGQAIDIALMDSQLAMLAEAAAPALSKGREAPWVPFRHGLQATRDGYLAINVGSPANWRRVALAIGRPAMELPVDRSLAERAIEEWAAGVTTAEAEAALQAAGAPYGVMRSIHDAVEHPYFAERGMVVDIPDLAAGSVRTISSPLFFSAAASEPAGPSPFAGQDTAALLRELGRSDAEIGRLIAAGIVEDAAEGRAHP